MLPMRFARNSRFSIPRRRWRLSFAALCLVAVTAFPRLASPFRQEAPPPYAKAIQAYERFVAERLAYDRIPGLSVGFTKGDFSWSRGFGWADVENNVPAKAESAYRLASVTKTVTAVAVLTLVEEGKIDPDAPIQRYVPYFPRKKWPVTVRQLLGHIGGISHYKNDAAESHIKEPKTTREALAIFQDFDLVAEPGTRYHYSTYGYNLLGAAIEAVSGLPYGEFVKSRILVPLGMSDTRLDNPLEIIPNRVRGYQLIRGKLKNSEYVDISSRFAGGGLRSTVVDLLKFARGIIDRKLLQEATRRQMFTSMALRNRRLTGYGMSWRVEPCNGHFTIDHGGSQPETRTHLLIFPEEKFALAIACNLEDVNLQPYVSRLIDAVLDEDVDRRAYAPDKTRRSVGEAIYQVYSYGMSAHSWPGALPADSRNDLKDAFDYFGGCVAEDSLNRDYEGTKKKIQAGIHPLSKQAFTKVGSYMAQALEEEKGREELRRYHRRGPFAFFHDYILVADASPKRHPHFSAEFKRLVKAWNRDWERTHSDDVRSGVITPGTDFGELIPRLRDIFAGATVYPDFTFDLADAAQYYLESGEIARNIMILTLGRNLYPGSPLLAAALGFTRLWMRDAESGRQLLREAHELDPMDEALQPRPFIASMRRLVEADRLKEAEALGLMGAEFNPRDPDLPTALGELSLRMGQEDKAVEYLKKALKIDPDFEKAIIRLKSIKR
jgi:CubicO group peptidase (beta-lactamase class C family)/tetratricopeptide (TPR) repeat protein